MGIPAPSPVPLFGNFLREMQLGPFKYQEELYRRYKTEKVYGYYSCKTPVLYIRDLDMIRDISVKHFNSFVNHREFKMDEPFNHSLGALKDDHWKNVRNTVSPTFSSSKLRRMFQHVSSCARTLVENLRERKDQGEAVELKQVLSCYTMDAVAGTGFGVRINSFKDEGDEFVTKAKEIMSSLYRMLLANFFFPFMGDNWKKFGIKLLPVEPVRFFSRFVDEALEGRKEAASSGVSKRNDFLQLLLESEREDGADNDNMDENEAGELKTSTGRQPLSRVEIQGQSLFFILAGYDTTATLLSFALFLLAQNPDCCSRLQQEIDDTLGREEPTYDTMQGLTYLDMCVSETLRLYPPGFQVDRTCNKDTVVGGVHIPKGMVVCFPLFSIHRDPAIWPDPMTFDPDRFSQENKSERHPYAHLPWGSGPRNCIGMRLALLEIKVALSAILQEMTPVVCSKTVFPIRLKNYWMVAEDGMWVKMADRADR